MIQGIIQDALNPATSGTRTTDATPPSFLTAPSSLMDAATLGSVRRGCRSAWFQMATMTYPLMQLSKLRAHAALATDISTNGPIHAPVDAKAASFHTAIQSRDRAEGKAAPPKTSRRTSVLEWTIYVRIIVWSWMGWEAWPCLLRRGQNFATV